MDVSHASFPTDSGQRLEIVCPKLYSDQIGYDPLLKYKNASGEEGQMQLAIGDKRRYSAPPSMK